MKMFALRNIETKEWIVMGFSTMIPLFTHEEHVWKHFYGDRTVDQIPPGFEVVEVTIAEVFPD